ncbi:MAG: hypothetical protein MJ092_02075 [Lachnospiraceae bacterium]|nr:hypothetical protein [Lachnospiraceae bacterium]
MKKIKYLCVFLLALLMLISILPFSSMTVRANPSSWVPEGDYWYYYDANDEKVSGWQLINNHWYYFDPVNYCRMVSDEMEIDGKYYFFGDANDGAMKTGWVNRDGDWYGYSASGAALTGWQTINNHQYYFYPDGMMVIEWECINSAGQLDYENGDYYLAGDDGIKIVDAWGFYEDAWYYFDSDGLYVIDCWYKINNKWYSFDEYGEMRTGWACLNNAGKVDYENGDYYYFGEDGAMRTNSWVCIEGNWYYYGANGKEVHGFQTINGKIYYFSLSGQMVANDWAYVNDDGVECGEDSSYYYFDENGVMVTNRWISDGGNWRYYGDDGKEYQGWLNRNGTWYYLAPDNDNVMATGFVWFDQNGNHNTSGLISTSDTGYYCDNSGAMQTGWVDISKDDFSYPEGRWIYAAPNGALYTNGTYMINGKAYEFDIVGIWTGSNGYKPPVG